MNRKNLLNHKDSWSLSSNCGIENWEKMNRAFDTLKDFADKIKPYIEEMQELQEFEYEERPKYPFIRSIGKKYRPNFNNKVVYHRCRDRC